jgi:hypothetical protein
MRSKAQLKYADIADHSEDNRIAIIGHQATVLRKEVAFVTDAEPPDKANRYMEKLQTRFPGIRILGRANGPVAGTVTVKVGPPELNN